MDPREARFVEPFYLQMMRRNAVEAGPTLVPAIIESARDASAADVIWLLRGAWRQQVMGAWLSVRYVDPDVHEALLASLQTSAGTLTSPPLATAAVLLLGRQSLAALDVYLAADLRHSWGGAGFIGAAVSHLHDGVDNAEPSVSPTPDDLAGLEAMLQVAASIRAG